METTNLYTWSWLNMIWVNHPDNPGKVWEGVSRKWTGKVVWALVENTSRSSFILVEQFRPLLDARVIECVAWLVDDWFSPEDAIKKEILEETGYVTKRLEYLFKWPKSAGLTDETTIDFYAQAHGNPWAQQLEDSEQWLIVHETQNSLTDLKRFLESEEKSWKLIAPGIWGMVWKALVDGKIAL